MMNNVQVFNNNEFGTVRVVMKGNNPWFVAKDVAEVLAFSETAAMTRHLDPDEVKSVKLEGMNMMSTLINESGLYSAIIRSRKPEAKKFKKWVTSEVLPSIRKHGAYMTETTLIKAQENPDFVLNLTQRLQEEQEARIAAEEKVAIAEMTIQDMIPKAEFYDDVMATTETFDIGQVAKMITETTQRKIGRTKLFKILREEKILDSKNIPYQKYVSAGYFRVVLTIKQTSEENIIISTPVAYPKGIDFIRKKLVAYWKKKLKAYYES